MNNNKGDAQKEKPKKESSALQRALQVLRTVMDKQLNFGGTDTITEGLL